MRFLKGISILTFIVGVLSGMATHWILDAPFYTKALCVIILWLSALLCFANDMDKERMKT
jgi:F0F1-type ATP synthase assembly protein I